MFAKTASIISLMVLAGTFLFLHGCAIDQDVIEDAHEVNLVVLDFSQQVDGAKGGTALDIIAK